jgi:hypothetical protein
MALTAWGDRWVAPAQGPPVQFRHQPCGEVFVPEVRCSHCGEPATADNVDVLPGPGGRAGPGTRLMAKTLRGRQ